MSGELDETFAGLNFHASNNEGYTSEEGSNSIFDRTNNTGMDVDRSQRAPAMLSPMLTSEYGSDRICELVCFFLLERKVSDQGAAAPYDTFSPSQSSNDAESSLRPSLGYRSERSSTSLRSHIYTPRNRSATIYSQDSNSAWETDASQPADDGDLRPMPDEGSASMQSYNDSQTGIWSQEDIYEQVIPYTTVTDMDHDIGHLSPMTQPLPQIAGTYSAAPFGTRSYFFGGAPFVHRGFGAEGILGTAAPLFTPPSTSQYSASRYFYPSIDGRSGLSIVVDNTMDPGIPSAQQLLEVQHPVYPLGSDQSSFSNLAPNTTSHNPRLPTGDVEFLSSPAPAPSPSISAATSTSIVERCPHRGCRKVFTGPSWRDSLRRHRSNAHGNKPKPICPVCHKIFRGGRKDNMKRHVENQHPGYELP